MDAWRLFCLGLVEQLAVPGSRRTQSIRSLDLPENTKREITFVLRPVDDYTGDKSNIDPRRMGLVGCFSSSS